MAGGTVGTVRARLRLPTVAECAELLAGGWTPVLGRLGVWVDDSGDSMLKKGAVSWLPKFTSPPGFWRTTASDVIVTV